MVNFGYPYNDIVICRDSTDYLEPVVQISMVSILAYESKGIASNLFLEKFKRKLSPDKDFDGQSGTTKPIRNNEPDVVVVITQFTGLPY